VHDLGYMFVLYPVLLNSMLLMFAAVIFNRLLGKQYPQKAQLNRRTAGPTPTQKVSIQPQDIQNVLDHQTQLLDISDYDLQKIILKAQEIANARAVSEFTCRDIMTRQVICLRAEDDIQSALEKFKQVNLMSLPVVSDLADSGLGAVFCRALVQLYSSGGAAAPDRHHQPRGYDRRAESAAEPAA